MASLVRLRECRERQFLTQQELADRAGVAKVTVARIEGGATTPSFVTIRKLANALNVAPTELVPDASVLRRPRRQQQSRRD